MPNLMEEIMQDANAVQDKLLGPTYPYYKNIKTPSEIGMSTKGSLSAVANDITGLIAYVEVLVTGKSKASTTGGPLGNKFFLKTGAKCKAKSNNKQVDRYIYVNNVPVGNIPFISSGLDVNFSEFKGLIPGTMGNLNVLNPFSIMSAFLAGSTPECQELTMQTIDNKNNKSSETHYVTTVDIKNMDPCTFQNGRNPVDNSKCRETFQSESEPVSLPTDPIVQLYFLGLAIVGLYVLSKLMAKAR
jgi:hypothetical protein